MLDAEIKRIIEDLKLFDKMYEVIRLVDPVNKKVLSYSKGTINNSDFICYETWETGNVCENCISIRSLIDNKTYVKFEYSPSKIYMITSVPVEINNKKAVIELLKDATGSMVFNLHDKDSLSEIHSLIDNLNSLALKDSLTGIYNRRFISERLPADIITSSIENKDLSIIFTDIDYFKNVNDKYGHVAGDVVLKSFTDTISEFADSEGSWVARYGGEEFVICLPGKTLEEAAQVAEEVRENVEKKAIKIGDYSINITASFGVSDILSIAKANEELSVESLLKSADEKLYKAKNNGKNRVEA